MSALSERLANMTPLQRAVLALKETQARLDALEGRQAEPIAIIGMGCRLPGGVCDTEGYWRLLVEGRDAVGEIPPGRWDADAFYDPDPRAPGKMNTRRGGFLAGIEDFDNHFFGISDREAERIDPQHRLLLEVAWEALEDAGLVAGGLRGSRTGVFVGISHSEYGLMLSSDLAQADAFVASGTAQCIAANRISFLLDFVGPSVALDTACSASLVCVHLACQSIRAGECEVAMAGGVNVMLSPMATVNLTKAGLSAPDGRVRAFDAAASGYVRSEGAGLVVLKPLGAARRDGDPIYAVIRGSAVNQNGFGNGLSAPSRQAQEGVLRQAYSAARLSPELVQYVEAQGTGTRLGDAIEAAALGAVVGRGRSAENPCAIGSVKTNLGHMEAASGVASLMKVALALERKEIPPTLHFQTPSPDIPFGQLGLRVQGRLAPWPDSARGRFAGVSAFGFGGSNAHVVLGEAPPENVSAVEEGTGIGRRVYPLSARTESALRAVALRHAGFLRGGTAAWRDICHTAAARRTHHDCRMAVLADSGHRAAELLEGYLAGAVGGDVLVGRKPFDRGVRVAFLFDGEPLRWKDHLLGLRRVLGQFEGEVSEIGGVLRDAGGPELAAMLADGDGWGDQARALPAMVAVQLAVVGWWRRMGVSPGIVLGRGFGELAAASAAGILAPGDALRIAVACGRGDGPGAWGDVTHRGATLPFLSASDGRRHDGRGLDAARWARCSAPSDSLAAAIGQLESHGADVCLELGPGALVAAVRSVPRSGAGGVAMAMLGLDGEPIPDVLAALYVAGVDLSWKQIVSGAGRHVRLPTYPWQRRRLWVDREGWLANVPQSKVMGSAAVMGGEPSGAVEPGGGIGGIRVRPELNSPYVEPRTELERALARSWAEVLRLDRVGAHDNFFELGGDSLLATILLNRLQDQVGEVVHVLALFQSRTIHGLAEYLRQYYPDAIRRLYPGEPLGERREGGDVAIPVVGDREVEISSRLAMAFAPNRILAPTGGPKNRRAIFILSPPRSGTTLLRVMLAGHPRLFAPPELELLGFDTMAARKEAYGDAGGLWLEGAVRALMEAVGCGANEARATIARLEEEGRSTRDFYQLLQDAIGGRTLVDKTPSYSGQLHVLQHAEEIFDEPLYIHLLRHPCGMIRSFVDYKLHLTYSTRYKINLPLPFSPQQIGELVWVISHQNIMRAMETVPAQRCHRLRFEDLVGEPEATMRSLCDFVGLDYREEMTRPYDHAEGKMTDGVVAEGRMQGDLKFLVKHRAIDPAVADEWKRHMGVDFLGPPARRLATGFGYADLGPGGADVPRDAGDIRSFARSERKRDDEARETLARFDALTDDEVAALLARTLGDGESAR